MNESQTLLILGWGVGAILMLTLVLNAFALAAIK